MVSETTLRLGAAWDERSTKREGWSRKIIQQAMPSISFRLRARR